MGVIKRKYTEQFKEEAIKLAESVGIVQAGREALKRLLSNWEHPQALPQ